MSFLNGSKVVESTVHYFGDLNHGPRDYLTQNAPNPVGMNEKDIQAFWSEVVEQSDHDLIDPRCARLVTDIDLMREIMTAAREKQQRNSNRNRKLQLASSAY